MIVQTVSRTEVDSLPSLCTVHRPQSTDHSPESTVQRRAVHRRAVQCQSAGLLPQLAVNPAVKPANRTWRPRMAASVADGAVFMISSAAGGLAVEPSGGRVACSGWPGWSLVRRLTPDQLPESRIRAGD